MVGENPQKMNVLQIALTPKKVLLIGAGKAAALKARNVLQSDCSLTIIAEAIRDDFFLDKNVKIAKFDLAFLQNMVFDIAIDATGDDRLSKELFSHRKKYGFLLNCVDKPEFCDFYFGAAFKNYDLSVNVSTGGASPKYAQKIRDLIQKIIPIRSREFYETLKSNRKNNEKQAQKTGKVFLIGCGTGKAENLTLRALQTLSLIDVALIDNLVGEEIVKLLPNECIKIDAGKQKGRHNLSQDEINNKALEYVKMGLNVGRLKGGDPSIFGRLFEEAEFLHRNGAECETISGVTSAFAGCISGGITPTLRGFSTGVLIVSAHLKEALFNDEWVKKLNHCPYTTIVLMAHSFAAKIVQSAKEQGIDLSLNAAFISKIDSADQTTIVGTLGDLEKMAKMCEKPAILVIGKALSQAAKIPHIGKRIFL
ncbi:MAG: uroporphyrinogen-III C-methyltransferase [Helicobacteraceae bacterium]|nr:uroporphyrinogen-III C-methyltransferase [Helicobacteraceae bacterium]